MYLSACYFSSEESVTLKRSWPEMCENDSSSNSFKVSKTQLWSKTLRSPVYSNHKDFKKTPSSLPQKQEVDQLHHLRLTNSWSQLFCKPTGYPEMWRLYWKCNILLFYCLRMSIIAILCCLLMQFNWVQRGRCTALTPRSLFIPCNCTLSKTLKVTADSIRCYSRK